MAEKVIGFDLGGTNMRAAVVDPFGSVTEFRSHRTPTGKGPEAIVEAASFLVLEQLGRDDVGSIGVAIANVVDVRNNKLTRSPNIPDLNDFDLAKALSSRTGLDVYLENDATAAAMGEHWLGAGKGTDHMICITLGTGVGGGIIVDGQPLHGADGAAGELGHICLDLDGPPCGCGSNGCLEQFSSGAAIVRITKSRLSKYPDSALHSKLEFSAEDVAAAAVEGDRAAHEAFSEAGKYLGVALAGMVNVFNPEVVVITGGVASAWDLFIGAAREELLKRAFQQPLERVNIVRGTLGDNAGVLGAAKRAFSVKGFS